MVDEHRTASSLTEPKRADNSLLRCKHIFEAIQPMTFWKILLFICTETEEHLSTEVSSYTRSQDAARSQDLAAESTTEFS